MELTSFIFFMFCLLTILIYFVIPKKFQWFVLLISSIVFLFWDNFSISTVMQAIIVLIPTYILGIQIEKYSNTKKGKWLLIIGIAIILGQLAYLKYTNLFLTTAKHLLKLINIEYKFTPVYRDSLIGISYYSLIMISYLVDIYRGASKSQKNIFKCALFMSYFPILTSGPFIRYNDINEDLYGKHKFDYNRMCNGLVRVLWGIFKVLVISARLGIFVDGVYGNLESFNGIFVVAAVIFFTLQLYTNFSGSIDIIMGISEVMGVKLPENFSLPFFSKTITEFWKNWHITLGAWLRDYIFYPLQKSNVMQRLTKKCKEKFGKKNGKKIPMYLSMLVMWILIGTWHGGAYTFIIGSGILQFIYIFLENELEPIAKKVNEKLHINMNSFGYKLYQVIRTFLLFSFAMIFFRATSVSNAIDIIKSIFALNRPLGLNLELIGLDIYNLLPLVLSLIALFVVQLIARNGSVREKLFKKNIAIRWTILYILIFAIIVFGCYGASYDPVAFIYKQF